MVPVWKSPTDPRQCGRVNHSPRGDCCANTPRLRSELGDCAGDCMAVSGDMCLVPFERQAANTESKLSVYRAGPWKTTLVSSAPVSRLWHH